MRILEKIIEAIDGENAKATREMLRANDNRNQAEMNFWQGEMVALARCKAWILGFEFTENEPDVPEN